MKTWKGSLFGRPPLDFKPEPVDSVFRPFDFGEKPTAAGQPVFQRRSGQIEYIIKPTTGTAGNIAGHLAKVHLPITGAIVTGGGRAMLSVHRLPPIRTLKRYR
jgi:hypothetical protein